LQYNVSEAGHISILLYDLNGKLVKTIENQDKAKGIYQVNIKGSDLNTGTYIARILLDGQPMQAVKLSKMN
jgi:flagellar hook assembly protein FlgD